jgi:predicted dehydrogenase
MSATLRWGILGTGNIARQFSVGVSTCRRGGLAAVGSRSRLAAEAFAKAHGIPAAYGSYEQVLSDRAVDAAYIALPNSLHHEWTIKALRSGKHVLCEKPFASDAAQSQEMFDVGVGAGRVVVEAFMFRAHPLTAAVLGAVRQGAIGQVRLLRTSFCYRTSRVQDNIRFEADLAGGALMDIGCYCISFSRLFAGGEPSIVRAAAHKHESGVDDITVGFLQFPSGILATFTCGMIVQADNTAYICGDEGFIEVPVPWKPPAQQAAYTIARSTPPRMDSVSGKAAVPPPRETRHVDAGADVYALEADHFAATVFDGLPPLVTRDDTLGNMRVLDEIRRQIGDKR